MSTSWRYLVMKTMKAIDFLKWQRDEMFCCPHTREGRLVGKPSNGELRRWLEKGSVRVNQVRPKVGDLVRWPITDLVFFSRTKSQVTIICED